MAAQQHVVHPPKHEAEEEEPLLPNTKKSDKLKADIDDILDEIDDVLEDNAEAFVKSYVQKGGQ